MTWSLLLVRKCSTIVRPPWRGARLNIAKISPTSPQRPSVRHNKCCFANYNDYQGQKSATRSTSSRAWHGRVCGCSLVSSRLCNRREQLLTFLFVGSLKSGITAVAFLDKNSPHSQAARRHPERPRAPDAIDWPAPHACGCSCECSDVCRKLEVVEDTNTPFSPSYSRSVQAADGLDITSRWPPSKLLLQ